MKCEITGQELQTTFLGKIIGTVVKDERGKKHYISSQAQKTFATKKEVLEQIAQKKK
jgi:hypothetical protein